MGELSRITTEQALQVVDDERAQWQALVEEVGPERMEVPGASGDWTFKDVTAHLTFWMEKTVLTLEAIANQEEPQFADPWPPDMTDIEEINAWAYHQNKDRSTEDILTEADQSYGRMRLALELIPEDTLNATNLFDWQNNEPFAQWLVDRRLFNHYYREHEAALLEWLDRTSSGTA